MKDGMDVFNCRWSKHPAAIIPSQIKAAPLPEVIVEIQRKRSFSFAAGMVTIWTSIKALYSYYPWEVKQ
jgi:hypothetical protein